MLNIATAVVIYPLVRRQSETVSLGYVAARIMESTIIAIGLMSIISVVNVVDALGRRVWRCRGTALVDQGNSLRTPTNGRSSSGRGSLSASETA